MEELYDIQSTRLVAPQETPVDTDAEFSLRPKSLSEYIGQERAKQNLTDRKSVV